MLNKIVNEINTHLQLNTNKAYNFNIIGNGKVDQNDLRINGTINIIVNCGNTSIDEIYTSLDTITINIIKSEHAIKHIDRFANHNNIVHIVPTAYEMSPNTHNIIRIDNDELIYNNSTNLLLHPAAFSLLIMKHMYVRTKSYNLIGYSFSKSVRNLESFNDAKYDIVTFKDQKKVLKEVKTSIDKLLNVKNNPISCKELIRNKISDNDIVIIAEITTNHNGDINKLCNMALLAKEQGADIVKIQKRDIEMIYSQEKLNSKYKSKFGNTFKDYRVGLELSLKDLNQFNDFCIEHKIPWFASILDQRSYDFMLEHFKDMDVVKLPSTISNNEKYVFDILNRDSNIDIVLSTGMTDRDYVDKVLDSHDSIKNLYLVHAVSCYPTPLSDLNINIVKEYSRKSSYSNVYSGFSGHDIGSLGSILSIGAGAKLIEKHIKLGDDEELHFNNVALDVGTDEFKQFVQEIRAAAISMGSSKKHILAVEFHKYE